MSKTNYNFISRGFTPNYLYWSIAGIFIILLAWLFYFGQDKNKFAIEGEITRCNLRENLVFEYVSEKEKFPEFFDSNSREIVCPYKDGIPTDACDAILRTLQNCKKVYRSPLMGEDIYEKDAKEAVKVIMKAKGL